MSNYEQTAAPGENDPLALSEGVHQFTYAAGDKFKGMWNGEHKKHGLGVLNFADGSKYSGEFIEGWNQGFGVLSFPDKSRYEGEWVDGKYDGHGVYLLKDGMKYEGQFKAGKIQGGGRMTMSNGSFGHPRQEGVFQDGRLVSGGKQARAIQLAHDAQATALGRAKAAEEVK